MNYTNPSPKNLRDRITKPTTLFSRNTFHFPVIEVTFSRSSHRSFMLFFTLTTPFKFPIFSVVLRVIMAECVIFCFKLWPIVFQIVRLLTMPRLIGLWQRKVVFQNLNWNVWEKLKSQNLKVISFLCSFCQMSGGTWWDALP